MERQIRVSENRTIIYQQSSTTIRSVGVGCSRCPDVGLILFRHRFKALSHIRPSKSHSKFARDSFASKSKSARPIVDNCGIVLAAQQKQRKRRNQLRRQIDSNKSISIKGQHSCSPVERESLARVLRKPYLRANTKMYQSTLGTLIFVLCVDCIVSAPTSPLLSGLFPSSAAKRDEADVTGLTTYDQKQSGKYNIHVNIKDVAIIALEGDRTSGGIGDFGDDYYEDYDESDLTVNPIFGLITDKPSSWGSSTTTTTTQAPVPASNVAPIANQTAPIEEPLIKNPSTIVKEPNKTHSVLILDASQTESTVNGILLTTPTPSADSLPPKPLAPITVPPKPSNLKANVSHDIYQSQEIPVQVIFEPFRSHNKLLSGERPSEWQSSRQPYRTVPRRRITPPPQGDYDAVHHGSIGNAHRNVMGQKLRRNCIRDGNGRCQANNRRFGSPTL